MPGQISNPAVFLDVDTARMAAAAGDLPAFRRAAIEPAEALVDRALNQALPTRAKAQFLLKHAAFVKGHLMEIFERFEGRIECTEKAEWAYENLLRRFIQHPAGKELSAAEARTLPGTAPVRVLQGSVALLEAFRAIEHLYFGQAFSYMDWVNRVAKSLGVVGSDVAIAPTSLRPTAH